MAKAEINFISLIPGFSLKNKTALKKWIFNSVNKEKKKTGELAIVFCSDKYLLEINRKYLNHNYLTDIVTFQNTENQTVNGDLIISIDRVKENAEKFNVKFNDELHRVIIHGVLHLCGYKDKSSTHKKQMTRKEDYYLNLRPF